MIPAAAPGSFDVSRSRWAATAPRTKLVPPGTAHALDRKPRKRKTTVGVVGFWAGPEGPPVRRSWMMVRRADNTACLSEFVHVLQQSTPKLTLLECAWLAAALRSKILGMTVSMYDAAYTSWSCWLCMSGGNQCA